MLISRPKPIALSTTLLLLFCASLLVVTVARADTVRLTNGDVLTGTVKSFTENTLLLSTKWAGDISIKGDHIAALSTDEPFTVTWDDGSERVGRLEITSAGRIELVSPDKADEAAESGETSTDATGDQSGAERRLAWAERKAQDATERVVEESTEEGHGSVVEAESDLLTLADVSSIEPLTPYYRYTGNLNLGISLARGNSDTTDVNLDGLLAPSFGRNTVSLRGQLNRSVADGATTESNWRLNLNYERSFGASEKWYATFFNNYDNDDLAGLNLRIEAGIGVGYKFFTEKPTLLKMSLGPSYVSEKYVDQPSLGYAGLSASLDFEQNLWKTGLTLYNRDTLTVGVSRRQLVLYTTTGLKVPITADFSLAAEVQYNYNQEPEDQARKSDQYYTLKIGYEFGGDETDWWRGW